MFSPTYVEFSNLETKVKRLEYIVRQLITLLKCDVTGKGTQSDCSCHTCSAYNIAAHNFPTSYYE